MAEYRPFPDSRDDEFRAIASYAFSPESGPYDPDEAEDRPTLSRRRGLFDGDEPLAICAHHDFDLRIRGEDRRVAGLSAVACPPENRRRGCVRRLLRESLAEYSEDGIAYSALWPFEHEFYRKYGWATASRYAYLKAPPEQLAVGGGDGSANGSFDDASGSFDGASGSFRRLDGDDYDAIDPVLAAMADRYDLTMRRDEDWWRHRTLRSWERDPYVYGWERDGELRGFLRYTIGEDGDDRAMTVNDVAFADETAWLQLLRFCRNHDSQVDEVRIRAPPDANLLDRVSDPRAITHEVRAGPMIRLVDVAEALERLSPDLSARDVDGGRLRLVVSDPLAEWNDSRFDVRFGDGAVDVTEDENVDGDTLEGRPHVETDVGTLSQLYVGYLSVDEAVRLGELDPGRGGASLDALFPPRTTHLREGF